MTTRREFLRGLLGAPLAMYVPRLPLAAAPIITAWTYYTPALARPGEQWVGKWRRVGNAIEMHETRMR